MIYEPAEDSFLLAKFVKKYSKNKSVLDMGAGSGIQSKTAINSGASRVLAADINPEAVKHLQSLKITATRSNLFSNISGKFDLIVFNPPYLPLDSREDLESQQATTGGKLGDEIILRFLTKVSSHLDKSGKILLLLSSLTPKDRILKLLEKKRLKHKSIGSEKLFMEILEVWLIY